MKSYTKIKNELSSKQPSFLITNYEELNRVKLPLKVTERTLENT